MLEGLSLYDQLRSGAVLVAFGALLLGERYTKRVEWLRADFVLHLVGGLLLVLYPEGVVIHISTFKVDFLSLWLIRSLGNLLLAKAAQNWLTVDPDDNVRSSWLLSNYVGGTAILLCMLGCHSTHKEFLPQHVSLLMLITGAKLVLTIYHLFTSADFSESRSAAPGSQLTKHMLFDILLMAVGVALFLGIPKSMNVYLELKDLKPGSLQLYAVYLIGGLLLGTLVYQMLALRFADDDHKRAFFKARIVFLFLSLPWLFYYQKNYEMFNTKWFCVEIITTFVQFVNSILAACYTGKAKRA